MTRKPRILIVNDDGIHAPGIRHLWSALRAHAELTIVAPALEQSGRGVAITLTQPLHLEQVPWESETPAWKVNGTPADCVRLAIGVILSTPPDLIVSGINRGCNAGRGVFYSGTVGGVIEGALRSIPGIAFSCFDNESPNYQMCERYIAPLVHYILEHPLPPETVLNVNFPEKHRPVQGMKLARQGKGGFREDLDERIHPDGTPYYWMGGRWDTDHEEEEGDATLLFQGYITAVPIHVGELTHHETFEKRKVAFEERFGSLFSSGRHRSE